MTTKDKRYVGQPVRMVTTDQAGRMLDLDPSNIRQNIARGALQAEKFGRDWLIEVAEVERYARENRRQPKEASDAATTPT